MDQRRNIVGLNYALITSSEAEFIYLLRKEVITIVKKYEGKELIDKLKENILHAINYRYMMPELKDNEYRPYSLTHVIWQIE